MKKDIETIEGAIRRPIAFVDLELQIALRVAFRLDRGGCIHGHISRLT